MNHCRRAAGAPERPDARAVYSYYERWWRRAAGGAGPQRAAGGV